MNASSGSQPLSDDSYTLRYDSLAREVLKKAAEGIEEGLTDPAPAIVLNELADSSVNWTVRVWVNTTDYWAIRDKLTERVKNALDGAGLSIPFPQMDVHLKGTAPADAA